jgi:demethylmenaquinone methyltransferase/2-methoxy-6-polyprenyl-1,4-benzoquinol methylase
MAPGVSQKRPGGENGGEHDSTDFGFRQVRRGEKAHLVRAVFDGVAGRYDLMNDLMSLGLHRLWKRALIDWLAPRPGMTLIDVAGGTGDAASLFLKCCARQAGKQRAPATATRAIVCDVNRAMIAVGRDRALDRGVTHGIEWVCGDAEALPVPDDAADAYTIAFGLRNVTDKAAALSEARRVLRPGGRFLCLEFSHVVLPLLEQWYERYSFEVLPALGRVVTGQGDAYRYLAESIQRFPDQDSLAEMMRATGLARVSYRNLTGGIAALHSAWRL